MFNRKIVFFSISYYLLFYLDLYTSNHLNWENPFRIKTDSKIHSAVDFKSFDWSGGLIFSQKEILIEFMVKGEKGEFISDMNKNHFRVLISNGKKTYAVKILLLKKIKNKYQLLLKLPKVYQDGLYYFEIILNHYRKDSSTITFKSSQKLKFVKSLLNITFLIDNSGSMLENDPLNQRYKVIEKLLNNRKYKDIINEIAIIAFSDEAIILEPFTKKINQSKLFKLLSEKSQYKRTFLNKGLLLAKQFIDKNTHKKGRHILILLTDGIPSIAYKNEHTIFNQTQIPIYSIGFKGKWKDKPQLIGSGFDPVLLEKISLETGGLFFNGTQDVLEKIYGNIVQEASSKKIKYWIEPLYKNYNTDELISLNAYILNNDKEHTFNIKVYTKINHSLKKNQWKNHSYYIYKNIHLLKEKKILTQLMPFEEGHYKILSEIKRKGKVIKQKYFYITVKKNYLPLAKFTKQWNEFISFKDIGKKHIPFMISNNTDEVLLIKLDHLSLKDQNNYFDLYLKNSPIIIQNHSFYTDSIEINLNTIDRFIYKIHSGYFSLQVNNRYYIYSIDIEVKKRQFNHNLYSNANSNIYFKNNSLLNRWSILVILIIFIMAIIIIIRMYKRQ